MTELVNCLFKDWMPGGKIVYAIQAAYKLLVIANMQTHAVYNDIPSQSSKLNWIWSLSWKIQIEKFWYDCISYRASVIKNALPVSDEFQWVWVQFVCSCGWEDRNSYRMSGWLRFTMTVSQCASSWQLECAPCWHRTAVSLFCF